MGFLPSNSSYGQNFFLLISLDPVFPDPLHLRRFVCLHELAPRKDQEHVAGPNVAHEGASRSVDHFTSKMHGRTRALLWAASQR